MPLSFKDLSKDLSEADYKNIIREEQKKDQGFNVNAKDNRSNQPLIVSAAECGYANAVKALLSFPEININVKDENGCTALHYACRRGDNIKLIKSLLGYRFKRPDQPFEIANITLANKEGMTPLKLLSQSGEILQFLLNQACETGRLDVVEELIKIGVQLNTPDSESRTPLHLATEGGHLPIVQFLLSHNVNRESTLENQNTALHIAALKAYPEIVQELIAANANVNAENNDNQTPLMIAFDQVEKKPAELKQIIELFKGLPQAKFDLKKDIATRKTNPHQITYFHFAAANQISSECFEILFQLVTHGSDILNHCNDEGCAPLHLAVSNNIAMIRALKAKGADLLVKKRQIIRDHALREIDQGDSITPLHLIFMHHYYDALEPLLEGLTKQQITVLVAAKTQSKQTTVLHHAAECDDENCLTELLNNLDDAETELISENPDNALINSADIEGNTPVHKAIKKVKYGNYIALMNKGAKVNISNNEGMTAVHYVVQSGDYATLKETLPRLTKPEIVALFQMTNQKKSTLLHLAANIENKDQKEACEENALALLLRYLESVADKETFLKLINEKDDSDNTPTHIAALKKNIFNYIYLTEAGAKTDIKNGSVQTPAYLIRTHPLFSKMIGLRQQVQIYKKSIQAPLFTRLWCAASGASPVPMRASQDDGSKSKARPRAGSLADSSGSKSNSPRGRTPTPPSSTPSSARPLLTEPTISSGGSTPFTSVSASARSLEDDKRETTAQVDQLLYGYVLEDKKPHGLWNRIAQHFSTNFKTYLIIGVVTYFVVGFGLCALCAFFPPAVAAIPIYSGIGKALGAMKFLHIAAAYINPIAKAITTALPIIVPQAIILITNTTGVIGALFYGAAKGCKWLCSTKTSAAKNKTVIEYKTANELGIVVTSGTPEVTNNVPPISSAESPPELVLASSTADFGVIGWIKSFDDCFSPIRDGLWTSFFGDSEKEKPPLKRKQHTSSSEKPSEESQDTNINDNRPK